MKIIFHLFIYLSFNLHACYLLLVTCLRWGIPNTP